jgi:hypothetical protein
MHARIFTAALARPFAARALLAMALGLGACSPASTHRPRQPAAPTPPAPSGALREASVAATRLHITERFPGATFLEEAEFASAVVDHAFRYRVIESDAVIERPKEIFLTGGQYQIHWLRSTSYGTYTVGRESVSINCPSCYAPFLGLGNERVFFQHQDRLFLVSADDEGNIFELLPVSEP